MSSEQIRVRGRGLRTALRLGAAVAAVATVVVVGASGVAGSAVTPADSGTGSVRVDAAPASIDPIASASSNPSILAPPDMIVGESAGIINLVVKLADEGTNTVTVHYATANSTAFWSGSGCDSDYLGASGTLTFTPGEREEVVPVQIFDCNPVERFEAFTLELSAAVNGSITRASGRISIVDNDTTVATPRLFVRDAVVDEKDGVARVPVLLGGAGGQASNSTVTVNYATSDGTASAGLDYTTTTGTLTFAPHETAKTVVVPIIDDDSTEPSETFSLGLSSANNATISDSSGAVVIGASEGTTSTQPAILAPADLVLGDSEGYVDLVVRLSAPSLNQVSVLYATANSTAFWSGSGCSADYIGADDKLVFEPGETTKTVRVQILDCDDIEKLEGFTLGLTTAINGAISRASSRISLVNNQTVVATPRLFVRDAVVDESDGTALVSVLLGGTAGQASNSTVTVDYATADGTASAGADYTANTGTLTFAPGETAKTVVVAIADDGDTETAENFTLALSNPDQATISDSSGTVLIGASEGVASSQPSLLAPTDAVIGEADGFVDLIVRLSAPGQNTVTVNYTTENSTAFWSGSGCDADYIGLTTNTLTFAPGETTKVVRVQILDCDPVEGLEAFTFSLSAQTNSTITRASGRISIVDNDTVDATPAIVVRDAIVDEKDGTALVSVLLGGTGSQSSNSTVTVDYSTGNATATAGADYTASSGTLTFAPRETAKTVLVPIADDGTPEPAENFTLTVSNPTNATIGDGSGVVAIGASDAGSSSQPGISAPADVTVGERDGFVDLVVRLSSPGQNPVTVSYTTANETAFWSGNGCNADYIGVNGKLVFAVGETTKVVRVQILDCPIVELLETFRFELSTAINGTITRVSTKVSIRDNASTPTLTGIAVTPANPSVAAGANRQFTATGTFADASTSDLTDSVTWLSASPAVATISSGGLAHGLSGGTSTVSATLGSLSDSTVLTVTGPAGPAAQTISFAALADRTFGAADFTASANASSGLPVSFAASGNCTISGATIHLTGAGSCTITASQPGNASFAPAPSVARTFAIVKAAQTISFAALANKKLGDPDFTVSATASSGLPLSFSAGGSCSVSGARVHLIAVGNCTITASQAGNVNYVAAAAVARTFSIVRNTLPVRCRVPRVIGKQLAVAKSALSKAHCRTGTVTRVFSRTTRRGIVIGQSRRPGRVLPANSKIDLVVSRGRRR